MKRCARCQDLKPLDAFSRYARTSDGRQSYCKPCACSYRRAWRKANRVLQRDLAMPGEWASLDSVGR
jgi:hypothetical protein